MNKNEQKNLITNLRDTTMKRGMHCRAIGAANFFSLEEPLEPTVLVQAQITSGIAEQFRISIVMNSASKARNMHNADYYETKLSSMACSANFVREKRDTNVSLSTRIEITDAPPYTTSIEKAVDQLAFLADANWG